jgi:hypothetical protein
VAAGASVGASVIGASVAGASVAAGVPPQAVSARLAITNTESKASKRLVISYSSKMFVVILFPLARGSTTLLTKLAFVGLTSFQRSFSLS